MLLHFSQSLQVLCTVDSWSLIYLIMKAANLVIVLALPLPEHLRLCQTGKCLVWIDMLIYSTLQDTALAALSSLRCTLRNPLSSMLTLRTTSNQRRAIYFYFFSRKFLFFWGGFLVLCFSVSLIFCFSASLLFCFSAFLLFCFSAFPASLLFLLLCFLLSLLLCFSCFSCFSAFLLFAFPASLLFCFSVFPASLLLHFCAFLLLLFYFFFSSVMCFCYSTSCSFASLLPVFTVSLFFIFFCFILHCSVCILNETLERP